MFNIIYAMNLKMSINIAYLLMLLKVFKNRLAQKHVSFVLFGVSENLE